MSKTFDPSLLSGYLDGELEAEEKALVERVLDEQPERRRQLDDLKRLQQSLATLPAPQPSRDPVESVRQRIDQRQRSVATSSHPRWLHLTSLALAASLLLAVSWAIFGSNRDAPQVASEGSPEAGSEMAVQSQAPLAPQPSASEPPISERSPREPAAENRATESSDMVRERESMRPRDDASPLQLRRGGTLADGDGSGDAAVRGDGEADQALMLQEPSQASKESFGRSRSSRETSAPAADLRQRVEPAAPMQLRRNQEEPAAAMAMSAAGGAAGPQRAEVRDALVLRYFLPASEQAETVRWLHEIAPQDVVALSSVERSEAGDALGVPQTESLAADFADDAEESADGKKRFWFWGNPAEQRALRLAIENRAKATEAELKIVQPVEAASKALGTEGTDTAVKKRGDEKLSAPEAPQPEREPTGILIELIVRPTP